MARVRAVVFVAQQALELKRYRIAMPLQLRLQGGVVRPTQGLCDPLQVGGLGGQLVGLLVVQILDAVFHLAQKHVGLVQGQRGVGGHQSRLHQGLQG